MLISSFLHQRLSIVWKIARRDKLYSAGCHEVRLLLLDQGIGALGNHFCTRFHPALSEDMSHGLLYAEHANALTLHRCTSCSLDVLSPTVQLKGIANWTNDPLYVDRTYRSSPR